jgi:hypothetical protein
LRDTEAAAMRFTVRAEHNREPIERRFAAPSRPAEAWWLMAAGAIGIYIFDDNTDKDQSRRRDVMADWRL